MVNKTPVKRALPSMASRLGGAIQVEQQEKITELEAQVGELQTQLANPGDGLTVVEILVDDICPSQNPRTILHPESIPALANHIERNGQDNPISIYPNPTGSPKYLIEDGKRRWHSVKYLGWTTIKATIKAAPRDPILAALTTFTHHEDLHPLDLAETLVKAIQKATEIEPEQILKILARVVMRLSRQSTISELNQLADTNTLNQMQGLDKLGIIEQQERAVISFILNEGLKPSSVRSNLFSMLSLPADLISAIHQYGINSNIALALTGISARNLNTDDSIAQRERGLVIQEVVERNLSLRDTRDLVGQMKAKYLEPTTFSVRLEQVTGEIGRMLDSAIAGASSEEMAALKQFLTQKLEQLAAKDVV
jgi:ParB family transcriptional regulator, chromosome partitioning protein